MKPHGWPQGLPGAKSCDVTWAFLQLRCGRPRICGVAFMLATCSPGDGGDGPSSGQRGDSGVEAAEQVCESWLRKGADCYDELTYEELSAEFDECVEEWRAAGQAWREEFVDEVLSCGESLECQQVQDFDDICFCAGLVAVAGTLLDTDVVQTCCYSTVDCTTAVESSSFADTGAVADCLRRWVACEAERGAGDPYWSQDYCITLIALTGQARGEAAACAELPCADVSACLVSSGGFGF